MLLVSQIINSGIRNSLRRRFSLIRKRVSVYLIAGKLLKRLLEKLGKDDKPQDKSVSSDPNAESLRVKLCYYLGCFETA
jgi:hypothetical protein